MDPYEAGVKAGAAEEERVSREVAGKVATQLVKLISRSTGRGPTESTRRSTPI